MKRSEIKPGEFYRDALGDLSVAFPAAIDGAHYDSIQAPEGRWGTEPVHDGWHVELTDPPPWFSARWVSRGAMIAAVTKILAAMNFGDDDEAREVLRNLLEQLKKGAENE